jgi:hypothetical protein
MRVEGTRTGTTIVVTVVIGGVVGTGKENGIGSTEGFTGMIRVVWRIIKGRTLRRRRLIRTR